MGEQTKMELARMTINHVDEELARLFEKRMQAVEKIAAYKKENNIPIFDAKREEDNIARNAALIENEELKDFFVEWYRNTMAISREYQKKKLNIEE